MWFVRTILALTVSASLVLLPLGASASSSASDETHSSMQMHVAIGKLMDCCPDDMKGSPSHRRDGKCNMGFCCAGGVVALHAARVTSSEIAFTGSRKIAIPADQIISFRGGSPPFRPPRV